MSMDIYEAIEGRRSIRRFTATEPSREQINRILAAGRLAPSAKNRQPWRYVVCSGEAKAGICRAMEQGLLREAERPLLPGSARFLQSAGNTLNIMRQAPVLICVIDILGAPLTDALDVEDRVGEICNVESIGAALENMALAATAEGLGGLWIGDSFFAQVELEAELQLTQGYLAAIMAIGEPDEQPTARPRLPFDEIVEWRE